MKEPLYIITAFSKLKGERTSLCHPHDITWCLKVLHAIKDTRSRKATCYKHYRIEKTQPIELCLPFKNE